MSKFNQKESSKIENYMGGVAFKQTPKTELIFSVLSSFMENSYYEKADDRIKRISELVKKVAGGEPEFVAKLAIYTRNEFNMRSSFHVLIGELAKAHKGSNLVSRTIQKGVNRVDDLTEIVSYLGKPIPNQVKKGIAAALVKFNEYQLAKYRSEGKSFSLVDLFNLVHPKPEEETKEIWKDLMTGKLKQTGTTWEARLSAGEEPAKVWREMLKAGELGYMACLRNLRNILKTGDPEAIDLAIAMVSDKEKVARSRQLPFRFLSAHNALKDYDSEEGSIKFEKDSNPDAMINAIDKALEYSIDNIPLLKGKTVILTDNSGSMRGDHGGASLISAYSNRTTADIANLFAALYWKRADNTFIGLFGDTLITPKLDREKTVLENFKIIDTEGERCGAGTEAGMFVAFEKFLKEKISPERIVIFSDCQVGTGCKWYDRTGRSGGDFNKLFQNFKAMSPKTMVYSVDLRGYGNTLFANGVYEISGWSDKIFNLMEMAEIDKDALVNEIEKIQL